MTTRNFNSFRVLNNWQNYNHVKYLNMQHTFSDCGLYIIIHLQQNQYMFANSVVALKKALGF